MAPRLVAVDLDGTLLRWDGSIDPRDAGAIDRALRAGVAVTLATGRLATGALPVSRALGLAVPLVCADGGLLACPATGRALETSPLVSPAVGRACGVFRRLRLAPFVFCAGEIHGDEAHRPLCEALLRSWTDRFVLHGARPHVAPESSPWADDPVVLTMGVGERAAVEEAARIVGAQAGAALEVASFVLQGDAWAVRVRPAGLDKGRALAALARREGFSANEVAAVGDWYNDVPMLAWAGRSFAMADAPGDVRAAAAEVVSARRGEGGGVAEAIARLLSEKGALPAEPCGRAGACGA